MELREVVIADDLLELGIYADRRTIHYQVANGIMPAPRMLNKRYVWSRQQIEAFLAKDRAKTRKYPRAVS